MPTLDVSDLYAHQRAGLKHIVNRKGVACLFHDAGVGKTMTTLRYIEALARKSDRRVKVLVVAPLAAVATWPQEAKQWMPKDITVECAVLGGTIVKRAEALANSNVGENLAHHRHEAPAPAGDVQIFVVNIDTFSQRRGKGHTDLATKLLNSVKRFAPDLLVIDELHTCRNYSNRQRLMVRIAKHVKRRIGLTGTPMPKGIENVYRQLQVIDPEVFPTSYSGFLNTYAVMGGFQGREIVSYRNLDEFEAKLANIAHVVKKEDALDLPPETDVSVTVKLSAREAKAYRDLKKDLLVELEHGGLVTVDNALVKALRLRQIALGFLPDDGGYATLGTSKVTATASLVHDTLEGEQRLVVFTNFAQELAMLRQALSAPGTLVEVIDGSTPQAERLHIRRRFADTETYPQRTVLLAQVSTVNVGINELVSASHAIFTSLPTDRAVFDQAKARLSRKGQRKPVTYYYVEAAGTVDTVIRGAHLQRQDLEQAIVEHIKSV